VVLFLMAYVVPKFSAVYENATGKLPWLSALLMDWGRLLQAHGLAVLLVFLAGAAAMLYGLSRPELRQNMAAQLWRIPALGERMRIYELTRMYRALAMLLDGGIPVTSALEMVRGLLQPALRERLLSAGRMIREGRSISQAMELSGLATPVALRLMRVGERSGRMGEMMGRIAGFYEDETARWVEWFMRLFEPLLMVLIGLAIGIILILMYLPILEIAGSMQ
jgi:general secretion pathway protein F